jgi:outer membrane protein assembly factor BamC
MKQNLARAAACGVVVSLLAACSALDGDKVDYKSAQKASSLDIPPDLTKMSGDPRYTIPSSGSILASDMPNARAGVPTATNQLAAIKIERLGNQRWLVVDRPPELLWDAVATFWKDNGFILLIEDRPLGIYETDWAENRAKIPQDFIRNTIGKLLDSVYSSSERDKFRTRMERNAAGGTDIYITHRGMQEQGGSATIGQPGSTYWTPRQPDPELETEFLRRLMIKLGISNQQAAETVKAAAPSATSRVSQENGQWAVLIDDGFDRAWRRVGVSLDRSGFTVEDRDRSKGIYFVRYVPASADQKESGFFSKLFNGGSKENKPVKYRVLVQSNAQSSTVTLLDETGGTAPGSVAKQIAELLVADLK